MTWPAVDAGDPGHGHEDPAPAGDLDDEADDARAARVGAKSTTTSRTPTDLVAERVEDAQAGEARDEDAGRRCSRPRLSGWPPSYREGFRRRRPPRQCHGRHFAVVPRAGVSGAAPEVVAYEPGSSIGASVRA